MTVTATVLAAADTFIVAAADTGTSLEDFGTEPWWLILIKVLAVFVALTVTVILTIWAERRIVARMQQRSGPNRTGPFGSAQGLADGIKLALKEDIIPALADKPVYILAPIVSAIPAFVAFAVIPFGPTVSIFGERTPLQLTDLPIGVLFVLAMSALGVYGIVLAGWASGSTYPLLGGLRSAAQLISYEIPLGLSLVPVFLFAGSLSTSEIVDAQADRWFVLILAPSFIIFVISMVGETNRAPFDLPEAESELVGGFHTEYSSLKFAMFFLAEYINMVTVSAVATTLFLGGWRPPPIPFLSGLDTGFFPLVWFAAKVFGFLFFFIWLRGTLPRMRYDQFMKLGWKVLVPFSLIWILLVAAVQVISDRVATRDLLVYGGIVLTVLLLLAAFYPGGKPESGEPAEATAEPSAGGFPLPLLPGDPGAPTLPAPVTQRSLRSRAAVPAAAPDSEREVTRA